jgi:hypothetical protein
MEWQLCETVPPIYETELKIPDWGTEMTQGE